MKKKFGIVVVIIFIVLVIGGVTAYSYMNKGQMCSQGGRHEVSKREQITFNANDNFKNQKFKVTIDNSETEDEVAYVLRNPKGKIILEGKVKPKEKLEIPEKVYEGKKGIWKLDIDKEQNEDLTRVDYDFKADNK
ncbi:hypothetical protein SAMN02745163_00794 [Clostridium cavendishii DSM 21758]|uniref:Uncharacterized protein n=1 Tax=Clostridium cavendishii DSM 21758 TaxID=1121302 RepID=A0A1M6E9L3_9CLOT|nr:hypothetical protein [Clostridium cavendishii]SHI82059.1 hypothetical protein SAMN02745163_00794 [Clostridium cavendishii DSM 21758]